MLRRGFLFLILILRAQDLWACGEWAIAVVPPVVSDSALSRAIAYQVIDHVKKKEKRCQDFLKFDQTQLYFDYLGMTAFQGVTPQELRPHHVEVMIESMDAGYVMYIKASDSLDYAVASLYEIDYPAKVQLRKEIRISLEKAPLEQVRSKGLWNYLSYLTPNSVTLGFTNTQISLNPKDPAYDETDTRSRGVFPPLISSIAFRKISHRYAYDKDFGYGGSIFPSTYFFAIDQESKFQHNLNALDNNSIYMKTYGGCTNINAEGTLATRLGSTYAAIGWGPCLLHLQSDQEDGHFRLDSAVRFNIGHRAFITEPLFFFFDVDLLTFGKPLYNTSFARSSNISRGSLGLGWYIHDAEGKFMGFWRRMGVR